MLTSRLFPGSLAAAAPMFRGILAYLVVEALYFGFTLAYVFVKQGFDATLYVFLAQSVALALGYHLGLAAMSRSEKACSRTLQVSGIACSASMLLAVNAPLWALAPLLVLAGVAFGAAIGSKQWHEINNTRGTAREAYLLWIQSASLVVRVGGMGLGALVLWSFKENMQLFLTIATLLSILVLLAAGPINGTVLPTGAPRPWSALKCPRYWKSAPFFLLGAGGSALRTLVGLTGLLTVVGAPSSYSLAEAFVSVVAAGTAAWLSARPTNGPCLARLRMGLTLQGLSWLALGAALLYSPVLVFVFLVGSALSNPVVAACLSSLIMRSMEDFNQDLQSNMLARELLLLAARAAALALAWGMTVWVADPTTRLLMVLGLTVLVLPFEYFFARGIAARAKLAETVAVPA